MLFKYFIKLGNIAGPESDSIFFSEAGSGFCQNRGDPPKLIRDKFL
jgi:hypothetical protein